MIYMGLGDRETILFTSFLICSLNNNKTRLKHPQDPVHSKYAISFTRILNDSTTDTWTDTDILYIYIYVQARRKHFNMWGRNQVFVSVFNSTRT